MIKLDDSSNLDWKVVQEYQRNPIAADSEDEKSENAKMSTRTTSYNNDRSVDDIC
jgi:hypothetical protein